MCLSSKISSTVPIFCIIIIMTLSAGVITAQERKKSTPDELENIENASLDDMLLGAQEHLDRMRNVLDRALFLLEETRNGDKDILKLNCLNKKLAAIKGFLRVSEQSFLNLQETVARGDLKGARHQYSLIIIAARKVESLSIDAESCAGEILHYVGDTKVTPEIDPEIAEDDPTDESGVDSEFDRLTEGTPYQ